MSLRTFSITLYFTAGAIVLGLLFWLLQPVSFATLTATDGSTPVSVLGQAVLSAGLSGLCVDLLRFAAQKFWPAKKKPKFALRKVMNANLAAH